MKNWTFKKWNTILGWVVFAIAFFTYLSTIEPNFSFWDCGEYISSAVKLEVTHAPGAALFQLIGAVKYAIDKTQLSEFSSLYLSIDV
jgi:hypothetical protein